MNDLNEALRIDPRNHFALYARGNLFLGSGDQARASADYEQALQMNPNFAPAHYMRGRDHEDAGDLALALSHLRSAVRLDADHTPAWQALRRVEQKIDALDAARRRLGAGREAETFVAGQQPTNARSVENTLARLREQAQGQHASGGSPSVAASLTQGEMRALAAQIGQCWSVDAAMLGLEGIVVELRVQLDELGNVRNVVPGDRGVPTDPRSRAVYESARRTLLLPQCNPLRVPPDKHRAVMESTFRFNPRGLVQ